MEGSNGARARSRRSRAEEPRLLLEYRVHRGSWNIQNPRPSWIYRSRLSDVGKLGQIQSTLDQRLMKSIRKSLSLIRRSPNKEIIHMLESQNGDWTDGSTKQEAKNEIYP